MTKRLSTVCVFCLILTLAFAVSCGGDSGPRRPTGTGQVSGCVTFKDNPVVGATVRFTNSDGVLKEAQTDESGNYQMESMPAGPYLVGIEPANARDLPVIYVNPSDSGLVFTVLAGENQADFKLQ